MVKIWWDSSKLLTIAITSLILINFSALQWNCKKIWIWNLDQNLIMASLIMTIYTVLFYKFYAILRWKEHTTQVIINFSFKMFKMRFLRSSKMFKNSMKLTQKSITGKAVPNSWYFFVITNVGHYYARSNYW